MALKPGGGDKFTMVNTGPKLIKLLTFVFPISFEDHKNLIPAKVLEVSLYIVTIYY